MVIALYECECGVLVPWDSPTIRYVGDGTKQHQCRPDVPQAGHCGRAVEVSPAEVIRRIADLEAQLAEERERAEKAEARAIEHAANVGIERALRKEATERCARLRALVEREVATFEMYIEGGSRLGAEEQAWLDDARATLRQFLKAAEAAEGGE